VGANVRLRACVPSFRVFKVRRSFVIAISPFILFYIPPARYGKSFLILVDQFNFDLSQGFVELFRHGSWPIKRLLGHVFSVTSCWLHAIEVDTQLI